jgi:mRNA interferase MazF
VGVKARGRRGEVFLVDIAGARGREVRKARPWVIVSPDPVNVRLRTYVVVPLTTGVHGYAFRVPCRFAGRDGHIVVDQPRAVDESRLIKRLGAVTGATLSRTLATLREMFED